MIVDYDAELRRRAGRIRLVLTDCDGVLTDTGVYYSATGEELKRFSVRDGMGTELLRLAGIESGIISGEQSAGLERRAEKLMIRRLFTGIRDKDRLMTDILEQTSLTIDQIAYIGDDINDLQVIRRVGENGLTGAPADAMPEVLDAVHHICVATGGHGAFREFADWILSLRRTAGRTTLGYIDLSTTGKGGEWTERQ